MKLFLFFFLFLPLIANSKITFVFEVREFITQEPVKDVFIHLDQQQTITNSMGLSEMQVFNKERLADTLKLEHIDYTFELIPLASYDFKTKDGRFVIKIMAFPKPSRCLSVKSVSEKRKKYPKNELVHLEVFTINQDQNKWILNNGGQSFDITRDHTKDSAVLSTEMSPDEFDKGFYSNIRKDSIPLDLDWHQANYLFYPRSKSKMQSQLNLLQAHMELIEKHDSEIYWLERKHWKEIDRMQMKIDSLISVILDEPYFSPIAPEEPVVEEEIYWGILERAQYFYGEDELKKGILEIADRFESKYKGKIAINFEVDKRGQIKATKHWSTSEMEELVDQIKDHITRMRWTPARHNGKLIEDRFIVKVDLE